MTNTNIDKILKLLMNKKINLTMKNILCIILNLNSEISYSEENQILILKSEKQYLIENISYNDFIFLKKNVFNRYKIDDIEEIKEYIKHNLSKYLNDTKKSDFGRYYTPGELVDLIYEMLSSHISTEYSIMDLCCGYGAFIDKFKDFKFIGRDIDEDAIDFLKILGYNNVETDNSLLNIKRDKYRLSQEDKICIVGNPPYNDKTSKNKKNGKNAKRTINIDTDKDVKGRDLGHCFLNAYAKLNPEYICVLHPLSYLIKKSNFAKLQEFNRKYKLIDAYIFSSSLFKDLRKNTEFPVVAALYEKGEMTYELIRDFKFKVFKTNKYFKLNTITTIDDLPESKCIFGDNKKVGNRFKYPRRIDYAHVLKSDIDLYQYNIRDTNSLVTSGNVCMKKHNEDINYCTIMFDELPYFAYIQNYRMFIQNNFIIGNLSPLICINDIHNDKFKDLMTIGFIIREYRRLECLNIDNKDSIIYTKLMKEDYRNKADEYDELDRENFYKLFLNFIDDKAHRDKYKDKINEIISEYFKNLIENILFL